MRKELNKKIDQFIEENKEKIFRDIARLVAVDSVAGEPKPGAPYGEGPARALKLGLKIAGELGMDTVNCEDRIGYASIGSGEKYLATITHVDVVPAAGWAEDPFAMREREGYIIGRGVLDDKGPSVLCLYALKFLKDSGMELRYSVRAMLGTDEECGMSDVKYYLDNYPAPVFCFSPDANFPLCNGEKGSYHGRIISNYDLGNVVKIEGGLASNAVPDLAQAWVKAAGLKATERVEVEELDGLTHLTAHGIGGHAASPEDTINAIGVLVDYILDNKIANAQEEKYFSLLRLLHSSFDGSALGLAADDGLFKPLTIIGGVIGVEDGRIFQSIDSRYPTNTSGENIAARIRELAGETATVTVDADKEPFYMSLDNPAVQACINAYNEVTNEQAQPFTIGGGTYARMFPNAVSFGPEHDDRPQPDFAGPIHGVDEAASKADFLEALKVYILALIDLQKIDF